MEVREKIKDAIKANLLQLVIKYPDMSLGDIQSRINNIVDCIEILIDTNQGRSTKRHE